MNYWKDGDFLLRKKDFCERLPQIHNKNFLVHPLRPCPVRHRGDDVENFYF